MQLRQNDFASLLERCVILKDSKFVPLKVNLFSDGGLVYKRANRKSISEDILGCTQ